MTSKPNVARRQTSIYSRFVFLVLTNEGRQKIVLDKRRESYTELPPPPPKDPKTIQELHRLDELENTLFAQLKPPSDKRREYLEKLRDDTKVKSEAEKVRPLLFTTRRK